METRTTTCVARPRSLAPVLAAAALALVACDGAASREAVPVESTARRDAGSPDAGPAALDARAIEGLPRRGTRFPETQFALVQGDAADADRLADVETCGTCHEDVLETWRASAHARASFDNPWYRQSVDAIRDARGPEASRFCAGCHDPVLLVAGAMEHEIDPADPRAHAGVTCLVCHGTQEVRTDGVASYVLRTGAVPLPDPADPEEVRVHVAALTPAPLRTAELCGSCHRGFLGEEMGNPHHLGGIDDLTPWQRSGYARSPASRIDEPVTPATCQGCHMPSGLARHGDMAADAEGRFTLHRFAGAHTAMAAGMDDAEQLAAQQARLMDIASIDVAAARSPARERAWLPADGAAVRAGEAIELDVVVRNLGVGHRFPGGTLDAQDTWIELEVRDARGALVAEAGTRHAEGDEDDDTAHRLEATLVGEDAALERSHRVHRFAAKIFDHTLGPRDAAVVRYALDLPPRLAMPLEVRARLRHRRHNRALHGAACEAQRTARGQAFLAASRALGRAPIDACRPQPITELAGASVWIGAGAGAHRASGGALAPRWRRLFDHALGLIGDVQEHLDGARPTLAAGMSAARDDRARAMFLYQRARLEGRQGRLQYAIEAADAAEALIGPHPALARVRGDAYAEVWSWPAAAEAYARAAEGAPLDDTRWADLGRALGSAGEDEAALAAARRGLARSPRDASLLRTQHLALLHLRRPEHTLAGEAYLAHRVPDALPELRLRCADEDPRCALERLPVHVHAMRPAPPPPE